MHSVLGTTRISVFVLSLSLLFLLAAPAQAANPDSPSWGSTGLCSDAERGQWSYNGSEWSDAGLKDSFESGFDAWAQDVEEYKNNKYLITFGGQNWTARWQDMGGNGPFAKTTCGLVHNIEFNTFYLDEFKDPSASLSMDAVSAHEWGHAFGLGHTGDDEWVFGGTPTMATCAVDAGKVDLSNDDEAAILVQSSWEAVSSGNNLTANSSFEENENHVGQWITYNTPSFYASTSGGGVDGSAWYAVFKNAASYNNSSYVKNDTYFRLATGTLETFSARVNYRKSAGGDTGSVEVRLRTRLYPFGGDILASCGNLNSVGSIGPWLEKVRDCYPSSSTYWGYCTTSQYSIVGSYGGDGRLQTVVIVYNNMFRNIDQTNYPTYVQIDRTRVLVK